jgi:RNA polymerase sigma factor (sigma-70 family)
VTPVLAPRQRGDRSFERIYRRHAADVYRYALAILRNQADAEDVTQTTFMNAYRAFQAGERPLQPHNWLISIAHNVCRQRFRQSQRRVQEVAYDDTVAEAFVADDDAPSADDIKRALSHLAFNQRAALVMRELEGRSYAEIAEILELSVSAVETLIFRARRALREQLEDRLTCREAELAISRQLDGQLARGDKGPLRAHLRECDECSSLARKLRAQRAAIRSLALVPLPPSLASLFGGAAAGGAAWGLGVGVAAKAVAGVAAAALVAGGSYELVREAPWRSSEDQPPRAAQGAPPQADAEKRPTRAVVAVPVSTPLQPKAARKAGPQSGRKDARPPRKDLPAAAVEARAKGQAVAAAAKAKAASQPKPANEPREKATGKTKPKPTTAPSGKQGAGAPTKRKSPPAKSRKADRKVRTPAASMQVDVPSSLPGLSRPPAPGISP